MEMYNLQAANIIKFIEKSLLALIALLTIIAVTQEILNIIDNARVELADLLLLFIYTEVAPTNESHGPMGGADTRTF